MPALIERRRPSASATPWTGEERRQSTDRRRRRAPRDASDFKLPLNGEEISTLEGRSKPARGIAIAMVASGCMYSMLWLAAGVIFR